MSRRINDGFSNKEILQILLRDHFAHFKRFGDDDYRDPNENNPGLSLSSKGFYDHKTGDHGHLSILVRKYDLSHLGPQQDHLTRNQLKYKIPKPNIGTANYLWGNAVNGAEAFTLIEGYLTKDREIPPANYIDLVYSGHLRFLPANGPYPAALVHPFHLIGQDGSISEEIHKIHLTRPDGVPRKKHLGSAGHLSIFPPLDSENPDNCLLVTEGLEDALTMRNHYPRKVLVVTGSKANLKHLNHLAKPGEGVLIIADHDENANMQHNGQYEANKVRSQLKENKVNCIALMPKQPTWDANSAQQAGKIEKWWQSLVEVLCFTEDRPVIKQAKEMAPTQQVSRSGKWGVPLTPAGSAWDPPEDLFPTGNSDPHPIEMLPDAIRYAVEEVAEFVQAPVPLVVASALSTISTVVQGHYDVRRADGLQGPTSLYMLSIADSGERKSSSNKFSSVLWNHEKLEKERMGPELINYRAKKEAWDTKKAGVRQRLKEEQRSRKSTLEAESELSQLEHEEPELPRIPRWLYQDTTGEALLHQLTKWPVGTLESDEAGSVFGGYSMRESPMKLMGDLNRLWDALPLHVDRRHSDPLVVQGVRLSVGLMIQEPTLRSFFEKSKGLERGTGFLARFLVSWPSSRIGSRFFKKPPSEWPNLTAFHNRMEWLLKEELPINSQGHLEPEVIEFSPQASECWIRFYNELEQELILGKDMYDVRDVASKTAENAARIAANFHVFAGESSNQISADHLDAAKRIALWHLYEAQRFFSEIDMPPENAKAFEVYQWLQFRCLKEQTNFVLRRVLQRNGPVRKPPLLKEALNVLHEHSYCRAVKDGKQIRIEVNPSLLGIQDGSS